MLNDENNQELTSSSDMFQSRIDLGTIRSAVNRITSEFQKVIVGQKELADLIITAIFCDGHVLIEGVPGIAKTLAAKLMAKTLNVGFKRIQFTPDLMPSDVLGTSIFNPKITDFEFKQGPIFSNVILVDEINRAPAKTQSALFEVMEEKQVTIDGITHKMEEPFLVLATQNPIEQEGTYRLPEAQIDRFLFKIDISYPDAAEELRILELKHTNKNHLDLSGIQSVLSPSELIAIRDTVHSVKAETGMLKYITEIVQLTRNHGSIFLGASPRASVALLNSSKAYAAMNGRDFIIPDDVKFLAKPVLRHRLILTPEKELEGVPTDAVIKEIIEKVEIPR